MFETEVQSLDSHSDHAGLTEEGIEANFENSPAPYYGQRLCATSAGVQAPTRGTLGDSHLHMDECKLVREGLLS